MVDFAGGVIQAFVGPPELGAADDLEAIIVGFIGEAQESLDIAVQEIDSEIIAQAILDARWRGVSVRVFLEHSYLQTDLTEKDIAKIGNGRERCVHQGACDPAYPDACIPLAPPDLDCFDVDERSFAVLPPIPTTSTATATASGEKSRDMEPRRGDDDP